MKFMDKRKNVINLIRELFKHSHRDNCYNCKQLLRAMGLDPEKTFEENFKGEL